MLERTWRKKHRHTLVVATVHDAVARAFRADWVFDTECGKLTWFAEGGDVGVSPAEEASTVSQAA